MITKILEILRGLFFKLRCAVCRNCTAGGWKIRVGVGSRIVLGKNAACHFDGGFLLEQNGRISVRKDAELSVGKHFFMNSGGVIVAKEKIRIGDNVQFGSYVQLYDHDHDFRAVGGLKSGKFKTASIEIGNNVWIGAGSIILRGTVIGDNCVIGAGSIVRGTIPENTVFVQKRTAQFYNYDFLESE